MDKWHSDKPGLPSALEGSAWLVQICSLEIRAALSKPLSPAKQSKQKLLATLPNRTGFWWGNLTFQRRKQARGKTRSERKVQLQPTPNVLCVPPAPTYVIEMVSVEITWCKETSWRAKPQWNVQNPVSALFAESISFCVHTQTNGQEKQSRLLILRCATSHLKAGEEAALPQPGTCKHGNYKQKGYSSQKSHPFLPIPALSSSTASTWGFSVRQQCLAELLVGTLFFNKRKVPSESPLPCSCTASGKPHPVIPWFGVGGSFALLNDRAPKQNLKQTDSQTANLNDNETKSQS